MKLGRRELLKASAAAMLGSLMSKDLSAQPGKRSGLVTLFVCGDVMTGRGIDQVLPHPSDPRLYEGYVKNALTYVELAEKRNGAIAQPVGFSYVWGDALEALGTADVRIINLETSVTKSGKPLPKGINYRMNPENIPCITVAGIDCCVLANNHIFDWGDRGFFETLETLRSAGLKTAGVGRDDKEATRPAVCDVEGKGRVLVIGLGSTSSGIPESWAASIDKPGVNLLLDDSGDVSRITRQVKAVRRPRDIVVASIHWGSNWGYRIPRIHRELAHGLIDDAGVDVVHGHSSHHVKGIEIYHRKLILYGCGDFINDYEGIRGHEKYRGDLALMYLVSMSPVSRELRRVEMIPLQMRRFQLKRATKRDARWLRDVLVREGRALGTTAELGEDDRLTLHSVRQIEQ